ncbi:MAG: AraC family transcriptional regulator ligand-binding domain-containing protein [Bacteroidota bacterium]
MTFSGRFVYSFIQFCVQQGGESAALVSLTGMSPEELVSEETRVDASIYNAVLEHAADLQQDPSIGFHFGGFMSLSAAGLVSQICQSAGTVMEALQLVCDFSNLGCRAIPMQIKEVEEGFLFYLEPLTDWQMQSPESVRHTAEGMLLFQWRSFQSLTLQQFSPLAVQVASLEMGRAAEFKRAFGQSVQFGAPRYALLLDRSQVQAPVVSHDYRLLAVLVQHAEAKLAELHSTETLSGRIKRMVLQLNESGFPSLENIADVFHLSVRTLQRKLREENTTYKAVVEELRFSLADTYLKDKNLTIGEISDLLSYAEISAFSRAFRRKMGISPQQYREQLTLV